MIINLPNVAALIRAVSTVNPGNVAAVERIAADRPIDVGDLSALDAAAADALAEGADPEQLRADLGAARADLEKVGAAVGDGDLTADELVDEIKKAFEGSASLEFIADKLTLGEGVTVASWVDDARAGLDQCCAVADLTGEHSFGELARWIDIAKAKIFIVESLEKTIKDLEMERDAAVDAAVAAVEAADVARKC
jgi:multidrug efflux pump subunit AcrA (membrane-fusion protein)